MFRVEYQHLLEELDQFRVGFAVETRNIEALVHVPRIAQLEVLHRHLAIDELI